MKLAKLAMLIGTAVISFAATGPVAATWYPDDSGHSGITSVSSSTSSDASSTGSSSGGSSSGSTPIPEPSNIAMLALGVAGLIVGRYAARKKRKKL